MGVGGRPKPGLCRLASSSSESPDGGGSQAPGAEVGTELCACKEVSLLRASSAPLSSENLQKVS